MKYWANQPSATCDHRVNLGRLGQILVCLLLGLTAIPTRAATIIEVVPLTDRIVLVHFADGQVIHSQAGQTWGQESVRIKPLGANSASDANSYRISSTNDVAYYQPQSPTQVSRKSKGTDFAWSNVSPYCSLEHWLYLTLPQPLQRGKSYTIDIGTLATNGQVWPLKFDEASSRSEALHVNLLGYASGAPQKYAYLFHWLGDGGSLGLAAYKGKPFRLVDTRSGTTVLTGAVAFRKPSTQQETAQLADSPSGNFLGAEVYECDFSAVTRPGQYQIVVEGIGSSFPFRIAADIYREAFRTTVRGLYHNRSGIELAAPYTEFPRPAPHNPALTPGFTNKLFYTSVRMTEWGSEGGNATALKAGSKGTLESAGWYQDAGDWDSYYSHLSIAQQLFLAYEMAPRNFSDGELNLPEGLNGVPDILDEAAWLPRFLYRLRHELLAKGYGTGGVGLRIAGDAFGADNPNSILAGSWRDTNRLWAVSGEDPWSSYRYAGACAHLAYCLQLAGAKDPANIDWTTEGKEAYAWAAKNTRVGDETRNDPIALKHPRAYAAAALFRVTGNADYAKQFETDESDVTATTVLGQGEAGYPVLVCALGGGTPWPDTAFQSRMQRAVLATADEYGPNTAAKRSLRWGGNYYMPMLVGHQTTPAVLEVAAGCVVARQIDQARVRTYLGVLYTTCDYFLGGNSLNMTWATGLGPRHPNQVFHIDSWCVGYHPGMVPYGPWRTENPNPAWVTDHDWPNLTVYPPIAKWPGNERWFDNRWSPMNSEFTVSQTIAPSAAIYGLLCAPGLDAATSPPSVPLKIDGTKTNAMKISWPSVNTGGLVLQQTTNLSNPTWQPVPRFPSDDGTNKTILLPATDETALLRLRWP